MLSLSIGFPAALLASDTATQQGNNYIVGHKPSRRKHDAFAIFWKMRFDVAPKRILEDSELGTRNDAE